MRQEPTFWGADDFTFAPEPHHRSWPYPMDRLERLAYSLGVSDEELRDFLGREIERRSRLSATPQPGQT